MKYINWLSDNPITNDREDTLQFKDAANVLTQMIVQSDTPLTVGINGEWGSGKTSLMRLIETNIKEKKNPEILTTWFDTWKYTNEEEVWKLLMVSLIEDLNLPEKYNYDVEQLVSSAINIGLMTFNAYTTSGASLISDIPGLAKNVLSLPNSRKNRGETILKDKSTSIKNFRKQFEILVEKAVGKNGKYIIFIDDLDRVHPYKTIDTIESIKNFLSCDKCIFVIGCDYNYLNACIEKKYEGLRFDGKEYIEKIIQITYDMGNSNAQQLNIFLKKHLSPLFTTREDFDAARKLLIKSVGINPRKIKKVVNIYTIIHNLNSRGFDNCILFKLICLVEGWPEIHKKMLKGFFNGEYTYKEYETWATPIEDYNQFFGDYYPPELDEKTKEYPDGPDDVYESYLETKKRTIAKVNNNIKPEEIDNEYATLKLFLASDPLFPHYKSDFEKYISLIKAIDLNTIEILEKRELSDLPSVNDTRNIFENIKDYFDGQVVDGKYFNVVSKVILPKKSSPNNDIISIKFPIQPTGRLDSWEYHIIDSKKDDKYFFGLIENFEKSESSILWLIYPWGFPKSVMEKVADSKNIYLTSYYLLDDLNKELNPSNSIVK